MVADQYGVGRGISTDDAAFTLTDSVFGAVRHKMRVGEILSDLA